MVLLGFSLTLTVSSQVKRVQLVEPIYSRPNSVGSDPATSGGVDGTVALTCLVLVVVAVALLVFLVQAIQRQPSQRSPKRSWLGGRTQSAGGRFGSTSPARVSGSGKAKQLQSRLLVLLNGDRKTAERLLEQVQVANPDRSAEWCLDKVIYDLKRDRRG